MAKKQNTGKGETQGFGEMDWVSPGGGTVKTDPAGKPANDANFPNWVRQDMEYKASLPQQKFY